MDVEALAEAVAGGDRRALSRAITLVESSRADHRDGAARLLDRLAPRTGGALRLGLTGTPGVGKSTFVEALGLHLTGQGRRVAVMAVDPSSTRTGGSILGDKTRMERLAREPGAFVRPSPSQATLGGVARRTREVLALCEAAGFDVAIVETVGVGQSETAVAGLTDVFALLLAPAGGDELQGVKRGIMEAADLVLVNKADGDLAAQARRTAADYAGALRLLRRGAEDLEGFPKARTLSALEGRGVAEAWEEIAALHADRRDSGALAARRAAQAEAAFDAELRALILERLAADAGTAARAEALRRAVGQGARAPAAAAREALDASAAGV
ncbi:LAO/AO transport system kinase [Hasllibacter halocynthiae]|uniref:LAO/AO transport system kinase n=1 Tax=Hasllibacter halocynthiae TaxID=595589 RepID=A0A2T0X450_9RHOB|nr:methylmalonyl Co-A mutase-associated GTPase MeaB [Hasllibacter halocynthiae]PRY93719.1 LAO/AO transport system kinase [Hasllibacter halocynthiae]